MNVALETDGVVDLRIANDELSQEAFTAWILMCDQGMAVRFRMSDWAELLNTTPRRARDLVRELEGKNYVAVAPDATKRRRVFLVRRRPVINTKGAWFRL